MMFAELLALVFAGQRTQWHLPSSAAEAAEQQRQYAEHLERLLQAATELEDERTEQDRRLHNLEIENRRLREGRKRGGRAVETATEAYAHLGSALLARGVPADTLKAALAETFHSTGSTRPARSVESVMQEIARRKQQT
jgi:hypothetical protein